MNEVIVLSAYKHGISKDDILHAYRNSIWSWQPDVEFRMLVGPRHDGDLIEVGVSDRLDFPVIVHAMLARAKFLPKGW
jgi:hypothetical protein